ALTLIGISIILSSLIYLLPSNLSTLGNGTAVVYSIICGMMAHYIYYRKEVLSEDDFNLLKV
ncbi:hypothetical protein, partial [Chryseobacterium sp. SIMBA_038]